MAAVVILSGCTAETHSSEILENQPSKAFQESPAVSDKASDLPSDSAQDIAVNRLINMPERELIEKILREEAGPGPESGTKDLLEEETELPPTDEQEPELPDEDGSTPELLTLPDTDIPVSRDMESSIEAAGEEGL